MKIGIFSVSGINPGKYNLKDSRLDQVDAITKSKKKTYSQVELIAESAIADADAILSLQPCRADLILRDLEFIDGRLSRCKEESEKTLLSKLKSILEKEEFIFSAALNAQEYQVISGYGLFTAKPITLAQDSELEDLNNLLIRCVREAGFISFFTTGEKETRSWLIKKDISAHEAAGSVHSDIQKGFIRAEIIGFTDFIQSGGETAAKQAGKMRLEPKEYVMQDADLVNFRFNK
jgi:ribosome-binding ATPase YchF (GTP1/OBG family)